MVCVCIWRAKAIRVGWRRMDGERDRREEKVEPDDQRDKVAQPILVLQGMGWDGEVHARESTHETVSWGAEVGAQEPVSWGAEPPGNDGL